MATEEELKEGVLRLQPRTIPQQIGAAIRTLPARTVGALKETFAPEVNFIRDWQGAANRTAEEIRQGFTGDYSGQSATNAIPVGNRGVPIVDMSLSGESDVQTGDAVNRGARGRQGAIPFGPEKPPTVREQIQRVLSDKGPPSQSAVQRILAATPEFVAGIGGDMGSYSPGGANNPNLSQVSIIRGPSSPFYPHRDIDGTVGPIRQNVAYFGKRPDGSYTAIGEPIAFNAPGGEGGFLATGTEYVGDALADAMAAGQARGATKKTALEQQAAEREHAIRLERVKGDYDVQGSRIAADAAKEAAKARAEGMEGRRSTMTVQQAQQEFDQAIASLAEATQFGDAMPDAKIKKSYNLAKLKRLVQLFPEFKEVLEGMPTIKQ